MSALDYSTSLSRRLALSKTFIVLLGVAIFHLDNKKRVVILNGCMSSQ